MQNYDNMIGTLEDCVRYIGGVLEHPEETVNYRRNSLEDSCDKLNRLVSDLRLLQKAEAVREKLGLAKS